MRASLILMKEEHTLKEVAEITSHEKAVNSIIILNDGRVGSCSSDLTIQVFNPTNHYNQDIKIVAHQSAVTDLCKMPNSNTLISSSKDGEIKLWLIQPFTLVEITKIQAHKKYISKLFCLSNNRLASVSEDKTIKIWSLISPYNLIVTLKTNHNDILYESVLQLKNKEILVTGSTDFSSTFINFWNLEVYQCETEIHKLTEICHTPLLELDEEKLLIGGYQKLFIIDVRTYQITKTILLVKNEISSFLVLNKDIILLGCQQGKCYEFNVRIYVTKCLKLNMHNKFIKGIIQNNNNEILTCSDDSTIKVWSLS